MILVDDPPAFVGQTKVLPVQDPDTGLRIDFIFSNSTYEKEAIARARRVDIAGSAVNFVAPEDIVVHKIIAGRPTDKNIRKRSYQKLPATFSAQP